MRVSSPIASRGSKNATVTARKRPRVLILTVAMLGSVGLYTLLSNRLLLSTSGWTTGARGGDLGEFLPPVIRTTITQPLDTQEPQKEAKQRNEEDQQLTNNSNASPKLRNNKKGAQGESRHDGQHNQLEPHGRTGVEKSGSSIVQQPAQNATAGSRYAYAFLVAGCNPAKSTGYMGYLMNVITAKYILETSGSKADVVAMIRMSADAETARLPREHELLLEHAGVIIHYVPSSSTDNFYTAIMDKFRILDLIEYQYVIFLDSDLIPLCNLDYVFELADAGKLQDNVALAWRNEPATAGFFMMTPKEGDFDQLSAMTFNQTHGWGHKIEPPDEWESFREKGVKWTFYGAPADQGMIYHWGKYVKQSVSIVIHNKVETWLRNDATGKVERTKVEENLFGKGCGHSIRQRGDYRHPPYHDYFHFVGRSKPWMSDPEKWPEKIKADLKKAQTPLEFWFTALDKALMQYSLGIDDLPSMMHGGPPLGFVLWNRLLPKPGDKEKEAAMEERREEEEIATNELPSNNPGDSSSSRKLPTKEYQQQHKQPESASVSSIVQQPAQNATAGSRYAYAFLVAGCNPTKSTGYMGYLMNVITARYILETSGSKADVVAMIRMSADAETARLSREHELLLEHAGVIIRYVPSSPTDNFYTAIMDKFRILDLIEYRYVIFLDSDLIPFCNLDYVFELADAGKLQDNVALAWRNEPATAGFFMMTPKEGDFDQLSAMTFNQTHGWGHKIEPPDEWVSFREKGVKWTFYGAPADQGMIYHWGKYVKQSVSLVNRNKVETWQRNDVTRKVERIKVEENLFGKGCGHSVRAGPDYQHPPYHDYFHFVSRSKPWMSDPETWPKKTLADLSMARTPPEFWFTALDKARTHYNLNLTKSDLPSIMHGWPPLGLVLWNRLLPKPGDNKSKAAAQK